MTDSPDRQTADRPPASPTRRSLLATGGGLAAAGLAGCLGGTAGGELPEPVSLNAEQACDECAMIIQDHPGPTGQIYFSSLHDERDGPARFCSGVCAYVYRFNRVAEGATPIGTYLTDYSSIDYELSDDPDPFISPALTAETFAPEAELFAVVGSDVRGAMGADVIPFSARGDAESFASTHGGSVRAASDIDRELIDGVKAASTL
ncbi:MAG: putative lipoprotein involved in nitrous oxide reduction [Halonotius sp. J07HN4]|jgi:Predicted lipoprotein involved in nitrous oxide reduction|nr:MAG: putative lipoprotein involved in nitrous oxide reduction [Halonotius sp. J07HN4]